MSILRSVNSLNSSDEILATIEVNGHQLASLNRRDFLNVDEVIHSIVSLAGSFIGLAKLHIRNKTQGWSMVMGIAPRHEICTPARPLHVAMPQAGRQLSIPWV